MQEAKRDLQLLARLIRQYHDQVDTTDEAEETGERDGHGGGDVIGEVHGAQALTTDEESWPDGTIHHTFQAGVKAPGIDGETHTTRVLDYQLTECETHAAGFFHVDQVDKDQAKHFANANRPTAANRRAPTIVEAHLYAYYLLAEIEHCAWPEQVMRIIEYLVLITGRSHEAIETLQITGKRPGKIKAGEGLIQCNTDHPRLLLAPFTAQAQTFHYEASPAGLMEIRLPAIAGHLLSGIEDSLGNCAPFDLRDPAALHEQFIHHYRPMFQPSQIRHYMAQRLRALGGDAGLIQGFTGNTIYCASQASYTYASLAPLRPLLAHTIDELYRASTTDNVHSAPCLLSSTAINLTRRKHLSIETAQQLFKGVRHDYHRARQRCNYVDAYNLQVTYSLLLTIVVSMTRFVRDAFIDSRQINLDRLLISTGEKDGAWFVHASTVPMPLQLSRILHDLIQAQWYLRWRQQCYQGLYWPSPCDSYPHLVDRGTYYSQGRSHWQIFAMRLDSMQWRAPSLSKIRTYCQRHGLEPYTLRHLARSFYLEWGVPPHYIDFLAKHFLEGQSIEQPHSLFSFTDLCAAVRPAQAAFIQLLGGNRL